MLALAGWTAPSSQAIHSRSCPPAQDLALVCRGWLDALRAHTPLCLELSKAAHLEPAALAWLSRVPVEASQGVAAAVCCPL